MINNQPIPDFDIFTFYVSDNQSSVLGAYELTNILFLLDLMNHKK